MITYTHEEAEQVKECQQCGASLARGYSWIMQEIEGKHRITRIWCFECSDKERYAKYKENKIINSRLLCDAYYLNDAELSISIEAIHAKAKEFERVVWFGGMQKTVVASHRSGMSFEAEGVKVMSFCSAARCMITMEEGDKMVTLITEEKSKEHRMGVQGIYATEEDAIALLKKVIALHKAGHTLKDDEDVRII